MANTQHVFEFLSGSPDLSHSICAIFGGERYLKTLAVKHFQDAAGEGSEEADFAVTKLEGNDTDWAQVMDELCTVSLFGGSGPKLVIVDNADDFVKKHRDRLEDFVANPRGNGILVLVVGTWAKNTKLYKSIDKSGCQIKCDPPTKPRGKNVDPAQVSKWLVSRAKDQHAFKLSTAGADLVVELTDCDFGRMEQELAKLALYVEARKETIKAEKVSEVVGGWRTRTMWNAIDAATEGNAAHALTLLDQLLKTGEHPLALFGQLSWSLRRYADVVDLVEREQRAGRKLNMKNVLKDAGFRAWGGELDTAGARIKRLGKQRASQLNSKLLHADLALKGTHSKENRGRLVLEELFVWLASEKA